MIFSYHSNPNIVDNYYFLVLHEGIPLPNMFFPFFTLCWCCMLSLKLHHTKIYKINLSNGVRTVYSTYIYEHKNKI